MPAITRVGDSEVPHCSGMVRSQGSGNVFVNGRPVSRQGDSNTAHLVPGSPCVGHSSTITSGSSTVYVNGRQIGRVGDPTCTMVSEGSPDTFAGG